MTTASTNAPSTDGTDNPWRFARMRSSSAADDLSIPATDRAMPWFKNHPNRADMAVAYCKRNGLRARYEAAFVMRCRTETGDGGGVATDDIFRSDVEVRIGERRSGAASPRAPTTHTATSVTTKANRRTITTSMDSGEVARSSRIS